MDPSGGNAQPMNEIMIRFDKLLQQSPGRRAERKQMTIAESRPVLEEVFSEKIITEEEVKRAALHAVEQEGIVFIDEIDKICSRTEYRGSADASSEGVQRDLLPLIEVFLFHSIKKKIDVLSYTLQRHRRGWWPHDIIRLIGRRISAPYAAIGVF
ncbi:AAA domain-containing protein [Pavlovales sp. CCMP2436]|nr:AAA domain-containing protein [Pavlovales sp. CCMP2436]